jgi:hypothetical protein
MGAEEGEGCKQVSTQRRARMEKKKVFRQEISPAERVERDAVRG